VNMEGTKHRRAGRPVSWTPGANSQAAHPIPKPTRDTAK
jgi:hypothetical protein